MLLYNESFYKSFSFIDIIKTYLLLYCCISAFQYCNIYKSETNQYNGFDGITGPIIIVNFHTKSAKQIQVPLHITHTHTMNTIMIICTRGTKYERGSS